MIEKHYRMSLKTRLLFYISGCLFATVSYIAGILAYGAESASWGDMLVYQYIRENLTTAFTSHMLTFFIWELVCVGISALIGCLFDREIYYRRKAERQANVDGVTEIFNHRYFQERLNAEVERANRYDRSLSVMMLDLDNFKAFNDTWGHQEGDKLLKWFASVCSRCVRNIDILARYGGEEFVVILPETTPDDALAVAERIRETVEKQSLVAFGKNRGVTVSAGIAGFPQHARTRHALILSADAALYQSKQRGRNRCLIYDEHFTRSYHATTNHVKALLALDDMAAIEALAAAIDARDVHTKGHSASVMRLSVDLAGKLGMTTEDIENLRSAALLHDLGKIGTPEEVLGKNTPLDANEWQQLENHAGLGSQILKRVQQMSSIIPGVKHHHERYDGKGYPNGLTGQNIPLVARIIAIADAYDAMTNPRAYRPAMSHEDAVEEIKRCAGSQFDPELVDQFLEVLEQNRKSEAA